ncbi:hypothetical protein ABZZ36_23980 [Actinacidiphila glaucinigra]|uniref:hypothetical protein n=1 Tax=Actinacidiphila glaucinigra TaxID=235986 RepID=UPI0033B168C9
MSLQHLARRAALVRPGPATALAGAALAACVSLAGPAPSAAAHPFGPPSTAEVSVQGSRLVIAWNTDKLDWVALGQSLGVFKGQETSSTLSFAQRLQSSQAVRAYLLAHLAVSEGGRACRGAVVGEMEGFLARGAQVAFACPAPVVEADVTISALTDLHPAYRTMLTSEGPAQPQQTLFTSARPTQHVKFSAAGESVQRTVAVFSAGTIAAAVAIGLFAFRRSRRRAAARDGGSIAAAVPSASTGSGPGAEATTTIGTGTGTRSKA